MNPSEQGKLAFQAGMSIKTNPYVFTLKPETQYEKDSNARSMDWNLAFYQARRKSLNLKY